MCLLSGGASPLGDKEIAVQVRGNSHYRNSPIGVKSECLSLCEMQWTLGQIGEPTADPAGVRRRGCSVLALSGGERLCFILLQKKKG